MSAATQTTTPTPKEFATVQALLALKGHQLIEGGDLKEGERDYLLNCWGWTRHCKTWAEVLAFLEQIGGKA